MQTIARANRVFEGKNNGLIVDYVGVFRNLQKALAVYATGKEEEEGGEAPVQDKEKLVDQLEEAIAEAKQFCKAQGVDLEKIIQAKGFDQIVYQEEFAKAIVEYQEVNESVSDAVEEVLINDEKKKQFNKHARVVNKLYKAILPDPAASKYLPVRSALKAIADMIKKLEPFQPDDISEVEAKIEEKLDESIVSEGYTIDYSADTIDIGKIDFEKLKERFNKKKHKRVELEKIKTTLKEQIEQMVEQNRTRMDFKERFEEMIEKYNNYSINVDLQFKELVDLASDLSEEGKRHAKENMTEEELAIFDIVTQREKIDLKPAERKKIKEGIHKLIEKLRQEKLVQDWKKQQRYISDVKVTIEQEFDSILPDQYDRRLFASTVNEVFDHVYQSY
jgi:type I restriction enzyme R subunit